MDATQRYFVGIHEFKRRQNDELDIHKGDYVELIEDDSKFGDSWYVGRNLTSGLTGLFPKAFTKPVARLPEHTAASTPRRTTPPREVTPTDRSSLSTRKTSPASLSSPGSAKSGPICGLNGSHHSGPGSGLPNGLPHKLNTDMHASTNLNGSSNSTSALSPVRNGTLRRVTSTGGETTHSGVPSLSHTMSEIDEALSEIAAATPASMDRVCLWTPYEVRAYFLSRGYDAQAAECFVHHQIVGATLLELDLAMLKELGIASFGTRFEISKDIKQLQHHVRESGQKLPDRDTATVVAGGPRTPQNGTPWSPSNTKSSSTSVLNSNPNSTIDSPAPSSVPRGSIRSIGSSGGLNSHTNNSHTQPNSYKSDNRESKSSVSGFSSSQNSSSVKNSSNYGRMQSVVDFSFEAVAALDDPVPSTPPMMHSRSVSDLVSTALTPPSAFLLPATVGARSSSTPGRSASQGDAETIASENAATTSAARAAKAHRRHSSIPSVLGDLSTPPGSNVVKRRPSPKRSGSTLKGLRSASSQYLRPSLIKQKTSAFMEGIQHINPEQSAKSAQHCGWMHKRGGVGSWKARYFTLHGTRLSYFSSFKDAKERGLIDITGHRAVALEGDDKFVSLLAAGVGAGRHCFKLVPPGPGYKKGVSFTPPKIHFFAVETAEEMHGWMTALLKATIERDESSPAVMSCTTPTVSLPRAQELLAVRAAQESSRITDLTAVSEASNVNGDAHSGSDRSESQYGMDTAYTDDMIRLMDRI